MNEILQSIRMIKFFAFEQPFEERILKAREEELKHLKWNFTLEVAFQFIWTASPILCILGSLCFLLSIFCYSFLTDTETASLFFDHANLLFASLVFLSLIMTIAVSFYVYTITMGQVLSPSTAFAALAVWNELRFALSELLSLSASLSLALPCQRHALLTSLSYHHALHQTSYRT